MHEAGHAVIRLASGSAAPVRSMTLFDPGGDVLGLVDASPLWRPESMDRRDPDAATRALHRGWANEDIVFYLAGPIAELRWRRHSRAAIWFGAREMAGRCLDGDVGWDTDFGRVRHRLRWLHGEGGREAFVSAWRTAEQRVADHASAISALGRLLRRDGHLEQEAIEAFWSDRKSRYPAS